MSNEGTTEPDSTQGMGDALIMFGLTGDLGEKKLLPALLELAESGLLRGPVVGVGRTERTDDDLWEMFTDATGVQRSEIESKLRLSYLAGDSQDAATYDRLEERLSNPGRPVIYAALPPHLFGGVANGIAQSSLPDQTRLVVEKPFGHDSASARELFAEITEHLPAGQLFAVDHFLAKSAVENMSTFRHANPIIESIFCNATVKRIEITMAEEFGIDGRGSFYEDVGAIKDVVQNHLLQMLAVLLMEEPANGSAEAFDQARAVLLGSIRPINPDESVRGQFNGYLDIEDVDNDSNTETYFATRLYVDTERWSDVEIVLRHGKELTATYTEAVVVFADASSPDGHDRAANRIRFVVKPEAGIGLELATLDPADHGLHQKMLWVEAPTNHGELGDYASMLAGALTGDQRHFARIDDIEAAWKIVEPVLNSVQTPVPYAPQSMGPTQADTLLTTKSWLPNSSV